MLRKIRMETAFLLSNIMFVALCSFLASLGGVLLWVNGGSTWYILQYYRMPGRMMSLGSAFVLWLCVYALIGVLVAIIIKSDGRGKSTLFSFAGVSAMYILSLAWYAVFFCTRLTLFSTVLLIVSILLGVLLLLKMHGRMLLSKMILRFIISVEAYFLYLSISIYISN